MTSAIAITNLSKTFGTGCSKKKALRNLSLSVAQGEVFGFLGPNGAGKSTTIKLLLGFLKQDSGIMTILDKIVGREEYRAAVGYLAEFPFFYDHLSAQETLALSGRLSAMGAKELKSLIPVVLSRMNLSDTANLRVGEFSKGMKQRLGMANAIIHDPEVLIFDEPMSGLDPIGRHLFKEVIKDLQREGKTVFFSSHILSDIEELCDRIGVIHKGNLLYSGKLTEFLTGASSLEQHFVEVIKEADHALLV